MILGTVLLIATVIGGVAYVVSRLEIISRQLCNLYVLQARKSVPPDDVMSGPPVRSEEELEAWERLLRIHFLGSGMSWTDADDARHRERYEKYGRWIAQHAPERIKNGCRKSELCPVCAKNLAEATAQWERLMSREKALGKPLKDTEYVIPVGSCPLDEAATGVVP